MTRKESEALKALSQKCSKKMRDLIDEEISMRSMIMSCLIYGGGKSFYDENSNEFGYYAEMYLNNSFSNQEVIDIFKEQKEEFLKGKVSISVYTDSEGCTYNSFQYADELVEAV